MAWLQLFVTKHVDYTVRAKKEDMTACVDFDITLSCTAWVHTKGRDRKSL